MFYWHSRLITRVTGGSNGQIVSKGLHLRYIRKSGFTTVASTSLENVDIAIVGGGPVGLALACALCQFIALVVSVISVYKYCL
jgi:hypothetical protein